MNRTEIIAKYAEKMGITKVDAVKNVSGLESVIVDALVDGEKVKLNIGTFDVAERAERDGRNPQTGESLVIAAHNSPRFKASKFLKDAVNGVVED